LRSLVFLPPRLLAIPQSSRSPLFPYTTLSDLASYENGERRSSRSLRKIAQVLRVESEWLETGNGPIDRRTVYTAPDTPTPAGSKDRKSTRLNSSHVKISYAVFCMKKKTQ